MKLIKYGYGDPCTWGPCTGHPNDPRTEDLSDLIEEEIDHLLCTDEYDPSVAENIYEAVSTVLFEEDVAKELGLSSERQDLLGAIATADFQAMGDAIRLISSGYWQIKAEAAAIEKYKNSQNDSDYDDYAPEYWR